MRARQTKTPVAIQVTIHNTTPFTNEQVEEIKKTAKRFGGFLNSWRQRFVDVFEHPSDASKVISIGSNYKTMTFWYCEEPYADYRGRIEHNDWSEYK